jgi:hypothetical protein
LASTVAVTWLSPSKYECVAFGVVQVVPRTIGAHRVACADRVFAGVPVAIAVEGEWRGTRN